MNTPSLHLSPSHPHLFHCLIFMKRGGNKSSSSSSLLTVALREPALAANPSRARGVKKVERKREGGGGRGREEKSR